MVKVNKNDIFEDLKILNHGCGLYWDHKICKPIYWKTIKDLNRESFLEHLENWVLRHGGGLFSNDEYIIFILRTLYKINSNELWGGKNLWPIETNTWVSYKENGQCSFTWYLTLKRKLKPHT